MFYINLKKKAKLRGKPLSEKIPFGAAVIFARKIRISKNPVKGTSSHRMQMAKAEKGYIIIEKEWEPV